MMHFSSLTEAIRRGVVSHVHRRSVPLTPQGNIVSFTFDDFPRSAYTVAGPILDKYKVRATYYVAMGLAGTTNHLGEHFRREDLESLVKDGHELGSHTYGHVSCRSVGVKEYMNDVARGVMALSAVQFKSAHINFSYPFGDVTTRVKKAIGGAVTSARGIIPGLNGPRADLNLLRANRLYGGLTTYERIKRQVLENERKHSWLIFYTHDVQSHPSAYGCSPELLTSVLSFVRERGTRVLTISEVLHESRVTSRTEAVIP